jgi:hypothetical protein
VHLAPNPITSPDSNEYRQQLLITGMPSLPCFALLELQHRDLLVGPNPIAKKYPRDVDQCALLATPSHRQTLSPSAPLCQEVPWSDIDHALLLSSALVDYKCAVLPTP